MEKVLMIASGLLISIGVLTLADGVAGALSNTSAKLSIYQSAAMTMSGVTTFVFAEILSVLKDIRSAVTKRPND